MNKIAPTVLRIGIAIVFIWFGAQQMINTSVWIGYIPKFVTTLTSLSASQIVYFNGIFEIIFACALLLGYFTRFTALILALHILDITFIVGLNATGVRDFGLFIATISIFLYGVDSFSLDYFSKTKLNNNE